MAQLTRQTHKLFGSSGSSDNFAKFGSLVAGSPLKTKDIATIQNLPAWDEGFQSAVYGGEKDILLQDLNAWCYEHSYQVAYILQEGTVAWDSGTTYYIGSIVKRGGTSELYASLVDNNLNQALPSQTDNANWQYLSRPKIVNAGVTLNAVPKVSDATLGKVIDSTFSDDGVNAIIATPLKFPDGSIQSVAATSVVTGQNVVTGSRALSTVFQNSGTKPLFVAVSLNINASQPGIAYVENNAAPSVIVAQAGAPGGANAQFQLFFIVLPGYYYKVLCSGSLLTWTEWS